MNINSVSITNLSNNKYNNPNFGSIIPVKVFIDGDPSVSKANTARALRQLTSLLFEQSSSTDAVAIKAKKTMEKFDKDYVDPKGEGKKHSLFRNRSLNGMSYFFTGKQAEQLNLIGKQIGPAKGRGLDDYNTTETAEAKALGSQYAKIVWTFITANSKFKIRESIDPVTGGYKGNEIGLCIFTESNGRVGKRDCKLTIKDVLFRKIVPVPPDQISPSRQTAKKAAQSAVKEVKAGENSTETKKRKSSGRKKPDADWPARAPKVEPAPHKGPQNWLDFQS